MFTGIIEQIGIIEEIEKEGRNFHFKISSEISKELRVDQSVSHNGVCLTVTRQEGNSHWVTAVNETLLRSNLGQQAIGNKLNIERCMKADGRFDGHIVQGHVDMTAEVTSFEEQEGSWIYSFEYGQTEEVLVDKGSVTVNGVSLTCFETTDNRFKVAIIPYTYEHTNFHELKVGFIVNLEFDVLGKYVQKLLAKKGKLA
ncbi:MAG: riboflavin synthase [Cyclobacteriaceae bacterium]|jgi:riboflavin synthase